MKNYSKQRELVLDILKGSKRHPGAEEVYLQAREVQPNISKGTVYRNLDVLVKNGIIKKVFTTNGVDRFDFVPDNHSHAVCQNCGRIFDITLPVDFSAIKSSVEEQSELQVSPGNLIVVGVCKDCRSKLNKDVPLS